MMIEKNILKMKHTMMKAVKKTVCKEKVEVDDEQTLKWFKSVLIFNNRLNSNETVNWLNNL